MSSLFHCLVSWSFHEHRRIARADPKAQQHEKDTGLLTRQLESKLPHLHPSIQLPEADANGVLTRFVAAYIDEVPDLLDAANEVAREAGIESQIKPVLKIAEQYFLQPPVNHGRARWSSTVCWTKPIWRTVWSKRSTTCTSSISARPLIPLDMTVASVIAHQLIGESLPIIWTKRCIRRSIDLLNDESFALESVEAYRERLNSPDTEAAWKRWPCLSRRLGVGLELEQHRAVNRVTRQDLCRSEPARDAPSDHPTSLRPIRRPSPASHCLQGFYPTAPIPVLVRYPAFQPSFQPTRGSITSLVP
jgi:hypothetical protein